MKRLSMYLILTMSVLTYAYLGIKPLVDGVAASLERSAEIIHNPQLARGN